MGAPANPKDIRTQGIDALKEGRVDVAAGLLCRYLDEAPNDDEAELALAAARSGQGRHGAALVIFERQLERNPRSALLNFNRATTLDRMGRKADAIKAYERTLQLNPAHAKAAQRLQALTGRARPAVAPKPAVPVLSAAQEEIPEVIAVDDDDVTEVELVEEGEKTGRWMHPVWVVAMLLVCVTAIGVAAMIGSIYFAGRVAGEMLLASIFLLGGMQTIADARRGVRNRPLALGIALTGLGVFALAGSGFDLLWTAVQPPDPVQRQLAAGLQQTQQTAPQTRAKRVPTEAEKAAAEEQRKKFLKEAEERQKQLQKEIEDREKRELAGQFDSAFADLRSDNVTKIADGCILLKNIAPNDHRAEVVGVLEGLLTKSDSTVRFWATQALAKWGARDSIAKLDALANDDIVSIRTLAKRAIDDIERREPPATEKDK